VAALKPDQLKTGTASASTRATNRFDRAEFEVTAYHGLAGRYLDVPAEARCVRK
jgi:hypothetical protein